MKTITRITFVLGTLLSITIQYSVCQNSMDIYDVQAKQTFRENKPLDNTSSNTPCPINPTVTYAGQTYNTVQIGTQCWFKENLNVGTRINCSADQTDNNIIEKYCYNDLESNCVIYGGLYQWNEMMQYVSDSGSQGICPIGWHIATSFEWDILANYIAQPNVGKKLQALGNPCINSGCENLGESGFDGLLGGLRYYNGSSLGIGAAGDFWTSSQSTSGYPYTYKMLHKDNTDIKTEAIYGSRGFSIRCLQDAGGSATIPTVTTSSMSDITQTSATSGGNVTSDGGATVIARGVCWSTSSNPTIADNHTTDGSGTDAFVSYLAGLLANTTYYVRAYATNSVGTAYGNEVSFTTLVWICGTSFTINHITGDVAPVTKMVTYGTVTNIPGETSKCWITSNLGADHQATAVNDASEASAGWYWQFNRKKGYKHDGTTLTPAWTITSINENSHWVLANDPCTIELGSGWRIPTFTEWTNVDASGGWNDWNGPWNSSLKMHVAGYIFCDNGSLGYRGDYGYYWNSMQINNSNSQYFYFTSSGSHMSNAVKAFGFSIRCIKDADNIESPTSQATNITFSNITTNQIIFNWTDGNGANRAVFIKQDSIGIASPVDSITYIPNTSLGSGSQIGTTGWYCVFNGITHPSGVTVTNLQPNTNYRVMVCEYNGNPGLEKYNTSSANNNPLTQKTTYTKLLNLKLYLEGLYVGGGWMHPALDENGPHWGSNIADKINIELHSSTNYPTISYTLENCILNSNGTVVAEVPSSFDGSYYITVKHRNSIETTTATPVSLMGSAPVTINFTTAASQAYGNNQKEIYGKCAIWGGDVNQDGIVDGSDMNYVDNATTAITFGYVDEDANGDGVVDAGDMNIIDNNSTALIMAVIPDGCPVPQAPTVGTHIPTPTQITWNWNAVSGATGYKWNTTNDYATATDLGNTTSKTETGLTCNTPYTRYVWAHNNCGNSMPLTLIQSTSACPFTCGQPIIDARDGKTYNTVQIGTQCWMKENLNVGAMINGTQEQTNNSIIEKYCYGEESNCAVSGGLYQWGEMVQYLNGSSNTTTWYPPPAGSIQGICPVGWHLPSDVEWCTLTFFLDNTVDCGTISWSGINAGGKMKEIGTTHWAPPNVGATNESGFTALPGGYRGSGGSFNTYGYLSYHWSYSESSITTAFHRDLDTAYDEVSRSITNKTLGLSVRCIKD